MSLCYFNFNAVYIMQNARLDEAQAGIKIVGRNINNLKYEIYRWHHAYGKNQRTKEPSDESERGKWRS